MQYKIIIIILFCRQFKDKVSFYTVIIIFFLNPFRHSECEYRRSHPLKKKKKKKTGSTQPEVKKFIITVKRSQHRQPKPESTPKASMFGRRLPGPTDDVAISWVVILSLFTYIYSIFLSHFFVI